MIIKEHGKLIFRENRSSDLRIPQIIKLQINHFLSLPLVNKLIVIASLLVGVTVIAFFALGIMDENYWGITYLDKSLFNSIVQGMFWPYLVLVWPALLISLVLGIYSGIQAGYVKERKSQIITAFLWDKLNELLDSFPRFVLILFIVFFIGADNDYYQLILLTVMGLLFVPIVYLHFKKRVQWLVKQHFIDAERLIGEKSWRIKLIQILWRNCRMLAISQFFYLYANIILTDACLGFLGVRQLRFPSLGGLLAAEISFYRVSFLPVFIPAAAITLLIVVLNLAGNYFKNLSRSQEETLKIYQL